MVIFMAILIAPRLRRACGCWWTNPDRLLKGRLQRDYRAILTPK